MPRSEEKQRIIDIAHKMITANVRRDDDGVQALYNELFAIDTGNVLPLTIMAWVDTGANECGWREPGVGLEIQFYDDEGNDRGLDAADPINQWVAAIIMARIIYDEEAFVTLLRQVNSPERLMWVDQILQLITEAIIRSSLLRRQRRATLN
jgi:hypothetical protein